MRIIDGLLEGTIGCCFGEGGAAIRNGGNTYLDNLLLEDNHVTGSNSGLNGGALENVFEAPLLEVNDSIIRGNTVEGGNGGGFANGGVMIVHRTTVDDNHVENAGGGDRNSRRPTNDHREHRQQQLLDVPRRWTPRR